MVKAGKERDGYSPLQRLKIRAVSTLGWMLTWLLGLTLRLERDNVEVLYNLRKEGQPGIYCFWHNQILLGAWVFRGHNFQVLTSKHLDGELITGTIRRFGFGAVRGSSTSGGVRALLKLKACLREGLDVAFTADGPRGPVYQAKTGAVFLAQKSKCPVVCFHIEPKRFWQLRSWDSFRIPKPFSRVLVKFGDPIFMEPEQPLEHLVSIFQDEMDRLRDYGAKYFASSG